MAQPLNVEPSSIPGLMVVHLPVHGDSRGWFKENWQRDKMVAAGLPDFQPIQNNISFNVARGVTRGFHAEPWDKFVSVATGSVFGAWVDLRQGPTFGKTFSCTITSDVAVFVPRGVANAFQTLEPDTAYTYLVNAHWREGSEYLSVNLSDPQIEVHWPIPLVDALTSEKDSHSPTLKEVRPMADRKLVVLGAGGQLGRELAAHMPRVVTRSHSEVDIAEAGALAGLDPTTTGAVINAAAFTEVDRAETIEGRAVAWRVNAEGPGRLADFCNELDVPLIHVSSDYVFDGSKHGEYLETQPLSPQGVYGQTKAAGDIAAARARRHYILRTSWVIGNGPNFVRTMFTLARKGAEALVVSDQRGRPTFTSELRQAAEHLMAVKAEYGIYNVTNSGDSVSWSELAREVYRLADADPNLIRDVTTSDYFADNPEAAPRPANSLLSLQKLKATGFASRDWRELLADYVADLKRDEQ